MQYLLSQEEMDSVEERSLSLIDEALTRIKKALLKTRAEISGDIFSGGPERFEHCIDAMMKVKQERLHGIVRVDIEDVFKIIESVFADTKKKAKECPTK